MKDTVKYILDNAIEGDTSEVTESEQDGFLTITIHAPKDTIGRVIGKGGKTVNAIKTLLKIRAIKEGKKIDVQVVEKA